MTLSNPAQYISGRTVQEQMNSLIDYVDQRAADVALDAIASDVAQVHQDMLDADADASAAAASAAAAAGTLANAVKKTGEASQSIAGDIAVAGTLSGGVVTGTQVTVPTPTNNTDAATKKYVDDADALKLNITDVNNYAVGLTGNQNVAGTKTFTAYNPFIIKDSNNWSGPSATYYLRPIMYMKDVNDNTVNEIYPTHDATGVNHMQIGCSAYADDGNGNYTVRKRAVFDIQVSASTGKCRLVLVTPNGTNKVIQDWVD